VCVCMRGGDGGETWAKLSFPKAGSEMAPVAGKCTLLGPVLVAYVCHPSFSGGRDQEDRGSKSAQANSS
jgi:hypothetical protein